MKPHRLPSSILVCVLLIYLCPLALAQAQAPVRVNSGLLDCHSSRPGGLVAASARNFACVFRPSTHDAPYQIYTAQVVNTGTNIGVTGKAHIAWTVYSHAGTVQPGDLAGDYIDTTGNIAPEAVADANTLVGGLENGFELQQINTEGRGSVKTVPGARTVSVHYGPPATAAEFKYYESAFRELYASAPASAAWIGRDGHVYRRCAAANPADVRSPVT